nr:class I poly(R)-hydroxyalkanoic acid synthase [Pandoraea sp.]
MKSASARVDPASMAGLFPGFGTSAAQASDMSEWFDALRRTLDPTFLSSLMPDGPAAVASRDSLPAVPALKMDPAQLNAIQADYWREFSDLMARCSSLPTDGLALADRRFAGDAWRSPMYAIPAALYLLNARFLTRLAAAVEADAKTRERLHFAVEQWIAAAAPSNFIATNPDAQQRLVETQGESLLAGLRHLLADFSKGKVSQTDETAFELGRNVASTEGAVVFENDLIQLIQYKPLTGTVFQRPLLIVPPCINKYYILDLQPANSLVRHAVEQGHTVFMVSWRNADETLTDKQWDDYIAEGPLKAIEVVRQISGQSQINALGFCVGGTLLATALAVLAGRGERGAKAPVKSLTLLTTLLDFSDTGILDVFIDDTHVQWREQTIGGKNGPCGLMRGVELANTFSFLRPNELVWNYVVDNYLKGQSPPAFDLLYWNGDSTNLAGPMFAWYLRHMYLQNELKQPGRLTVCGVPVDLGAIDVPVYIFGSREDHIVPWRAAYASTALLSGPKRFVLGASGHIAGVINPPAKQRRSYWTGDALPASADDWLASAQEHPGSWWPDWHAWLASHGGRRVKASSGYGNVQYQPVEPAPGRYVKAKA